MKLRDTVKMMDSSNHKDQLKAEYLQLKIRIEELTSMLCKYKAGTLPFKPTCSYGLLNGQLSYMRMYALTLEKRAKIEQIDLENITSVERLDLDGIASVEKTGSKNKPKMDKVKPTETSQIEKVE